MMVGAAQVDFEVEDEVETSAADEVGMSAAGAAYSELLLAQTDRIN